MYGLIKDHNRIKNTTIFQLTLFLALMGVIAYGLFLQKKDWERLVAHRSFAAAYVSDVFRTESRYHPVMIEVQFVVKGRSYKGQSI